MYSLSTTQTRPEKFTRRIVLSKLFSVFHPRRQIVPVTERVWIIFQELWQESTERDSILPETHTSKWQK